MKAWRFYAVGDMRLDEVPYPGALKPGWVTLKVRVVQPSVTEAIRAKGGPALGAEFIRKMIEEHAPVQLLGHEFSAEVVEVGECVTSLRVGDRVAARTKIPCYQCAVCKAGQQHRCKKGPSIGRQMPGAYAEYLSVPAEFVGALPAGLSDSEGACLQPLESSMACVADTDIQPADTVVILGQGSMGLNVLQLAKASGAGLTIGIDVRPSNLQMSKALGSDHQVNAVTDDPVAAVQELTKGLGADVVYECAAGSPGQGLAGSKTLEQAIQIVTDVGKVVQVAMFGGPITFLPDVFRSKSVRYIFPQSSSPALFEHVVRLVANGQVKIKPTITHVLEGLEKVPEAFEITGNKGKYNAVNPAQVVVSH